jgi:galactokinase/mevalonate kinase-like predicted kinase
MVVINEFDIIQLIKFQYSPAVIVKAPSRINLINPLDAVEADLWAPSMAANAIDNPLSAYVFISTVHEPNNENRWKMFDIKLENDNIELVQLSEEKFDFNSIKNEPAKFKGNIILASMAVLFEHIPEIFDRVKNQRIEIGVFTTIPRQSGIGGSSSIIIGLLWALAEFSGVMNLPPNRFVKMPVNRDVIAELCTQIENQMLNTTAGYGDRYTIARGGIGFVNYVGKLYHENLGEAPLATYDRIDRTYNIEQIPIILCYSGISHSSGDVHKVLREKYLSGDSFMKQKYQELGILSWKARYALMKHEWKILGTYFTENSMITDEIMKYCGFQFGIGWANRVLIDLMKNNKDVYAIKLSGAGGGGSVFALVNPHKINEILYEWKRKLEDLLENPEPFLKKNPEITKDMLFQLKNAEFYRITIDCDGVKRIL